MDTPVILEPSQYRDLADEVVLVDVRWYSDGRSGEAAYEQGHIPGAIWVDVDHDLSAPAVPGGARHPLPSPKLFAEALGRRGIPEDALVVAYDDVSGSTAARLVWLLRRAGQPAALLNGGLAGWEGETEEGRVVRAPVTRRPVPWPGERFIDPEAVLDGDGYDVLIDARAHERYTGDALNPLDPRHGHIPGAVNMPWAANMNEEGFFLEPDLLRQKYSVRGVEAGSRVVVYCGSGVTACTDLLALEHLGIQDVRLYPGSWSEWGSRPEWPMETGNHQGRG